MDPLSAFFAVLLLFSLAANAFLALSLYAFSHRLIDWIRDRLEITHDATSATIDARPEQRPAA